MAYEKQTWETGDIITADKLNHIEDGIENSENGYECTKEETVVFEGTLTVNSATGSFYFVNFTPTESFNSEFVVVNLDGTNYTLPKVSLSIGDVYGEANESGPSFATYPCAIHIFNGNYSFYVPQEGTYSVTIIALDVSVNDVTPCFRLAVNNSISKDGQQSVFPVNFTRNGDTFYVGTPYNNVKQAYFNDKILVAREGFNKCESFSAGIEDEYGNVNFKFIFLRQLSDNSGLECAIVTLKYNDTVTATIKKIALENLT